MKYFKRRWDEDPGGENASWGESDWYFETDSSGTVLRQIEVFDSGPTLFYDQDHLDDEFGSLAQTDLDLTEFKSFEITQEEFNERWQSLRPNNQN